VSERAAPSVTPEEARRLIRAETAALDAATEGRTLRIHRLRDLLRVDPTLPALLLEIMQSEELTDRTRADLYLALELAGTEPAQAALTSVIGNPAWSGRDSMRAIVALGGVGDPSSATVASLWSTAQGGAASGDGFDLAGAATLALGSLGQAMLGNEDADYPSLRARLVSGALGGTGTPEQRANYVHALGNTRDAALARDIVVLLDDPEPVVRRAAALSLGRLDVDRSADQLLSRFERDDSPEVRGAIAESLVSWTAPSADAVETMRDEIAAEANENTRFHMARFLGKNLGQFPESRPVLEQLLRTERSTRIRQSVAEALVIPP
jgi:HEAT repeat protein